MIVSRAAPCPVSLAHFDGSNARIWRVWLPTASCVTDRQAGGNVPNFGWTARERLRPTCFLTAAQPEASREWTPYPARRTTLQFTKESALARFLVMSCIFEVPCDVVHLQCLPQGSGSPWQQYLAHFYLTLRGPIAGTNRASRRHAGQAFNGARPGSAAPPS